MTGSQTLRDQAYWIDRYRKKGALWIHDDNPRRPHALLTSGKHSNGFFNGKLVTEDELLLAEAASNFVVWLSGLMDYCTIGRVVGPQTGATKLAEAVHLAINRNGGRCLWASPSKVGEGADKTMVFTDLDNAPKSGERVLLCEDALSTGGSVELTAKAVIACGATVLPFIAVLVNRSGLTRVDGKRIVALINYPMPMWTPEECPLCMVGSVAIRPRQPAENWGLLNAEY